MLGYVIIQFVYNYKTFDEFIAVLQVFKTYFLVVYI